MTREEASIIIGNIPINSDTMDDCYSITEYQEAKTMAIKALKRDPKWDRLYILINHIRDGIAPDETVTDTYQRHLRNTQAQLLDVIMYWMVQTERGL